MENYHVVKPTKSVGIGILLTLLFGPIGLFYSTVLGGIVMTAAPFILLGISFLGIGIENELLLTIGVSGFLVNLVLWWLICMIWSVIAITRYNKRIMRESNYNTSYQRVESAYDAPPYAPPINEQLGYQHTNRLQSGGLIDGAPNIQNWLKSNPDKGINDYYIKFRK